ncbi:MAG: metal-sensitive transcriptional regulator [Firmicutes bacterium]|nr:metal-sensitive transcriptional regulator [Bacillota bacterium]
MASIDEKTCFNSTTKEDILARLKRAEGQLRGIQKMVEEERSCQDLVIQLIAVKEAITQVAITALSNQLVHCLQIELKEGRSEEGVIEKFIQAFKKLS